MRYSVRYKIYKNDEEKQEALKEINEINIQCDLPLTSMEEFNTILETKMEILADNYSSLLSELKTYNGILEDQIISIEILSDDSKELLKDTDIVIVADTEDCDCNYDWTYRNVISFTRKIIQEYERKLAEKIDESES